MKQGIPFLLLSIFIFCIVSTSSYAQSNDYKIINISPDQTFQTMEGFGGSLAYYESWVTSHPNKAGIYDAIFSELSLDILRLRNAYGYDATMIDRAKEFVTAAEASLGNAIDVLVTSWGPPGYLKNTGDRKNGGTLKFEKTSNGVKFDYEGFAHWWNKSLDEYNSNGIFPTYISIQNEPDFSASWESCLMKPNEAVSATDTIAGYNNALDMVFNSIQERTNIPMLLGPENVGIGYNSVENYINSLDISKLFGIGHHLYHGVEEINPYASTNFSKVGNFHPEVPHFQTEFSGGNWWSIIGLIYKSLHNESTVAYLYWDLAWDGSGLVSMDHPWDRSRWSNTLGYRKTKEFYAFKQYSAFIHPGWQRVEASVPGDSVKVLTFMSPEKDSATVVLINTSKVTATQAAIILPGYSIDESSTYLTSATKNCALISEQNNSLVEISPLSVQTIFMEISESEDILTDSINLSSSSPEIDSRMDSLSISAEVFPESATNKTIFWQLVSGSEIASLSQNGSIKALGTGDGIAKIRATAIDGSEVYAEIDVEISNQVLVESINVTASAGKISTPEGSIQFTGTALPEEAFNKELYWELTSGNEIATISQTGILQALGVLDGSVGVKVSSTDGSEISKTLTISVTNQVSAIQTLADNDVKAWSSGNRIYYQIPLLLSSFQISLYSIDGKLIHSEKLPGTSSSGSFDIRDNAQAIFVLKISNEGNIATVILPIN